MYTNHSVTRRNKPVCCCLRCPMTIVHSVSWLLRMVIRIIMLIRCVERAARQCRENFGDFDAILWNFAAFRELEQSSCIYLRLSTYRNLIAIEIGLQVPNVMDYRGIYMINTYWCSTNVRYCQALQSDQRFRDFLCSHRLGSFYVLNYIFKSTIGLRTLLISSLTSCK